MFAVYDEAGEGYVIHDPIEGWIFTILPDHATTFSSQELALKTIQDKYKHCWKRLTIVPVL